MPSKKKKYNARFPAGRIKKIMQSDEEIGKVAQAVPVIISRTLELFVESLLAKTLKITNIRNAKTLSTSHLKQCIMAEQRFDFLRELVKNVPDISLAEEAAANYNDDDVVQSSPEQDSFSDAASEYNKSSNLMDFSQLAATSSAAMQIDIPLDMRKNGRTDNDNNETTAADNINNSVRCTRSMKYHEQQKQQRNQRECTPKTGSVIMHTNAVKLLRTESTPEANKPSGGSVGYCTSAKRARQQKIAATCTSELASSTSTIAAVSAPLLNFDFSSKPLVKIDYSNIAKTSVGNDAEDVAKYNIAQSAPATAAAQQSVFDFSQSSTPNISINIDFSSININATNIKPAAATIKTINNKPKAAIDSKLISTSRPNISTIPSALAAATSTLSATKDNTFLELDEDYDNI